MENDIPRDVPPPTAAEWSEHYNAIIPQLHVFSKTVAYKRK
jgi:hypothetical protein